MSLTTPGIGSGLDVKGIVDALIKADIEPTQKRIAKRAGAIDTNISALGAIKSSLARLQTSLANLSNLSTLFSLKNTTSDMDHFSISTTSQADPGLYQIGVLQLAQRQNLSSKTFTNSTTSVGTGSISIQLGTYSADNLTFTNNPDKQPITINITPGNDSLQNIRDAINNSNAGVQASIIKDNSGSKLTFTSKDNGENFAMKITVTDTDGVPTDTNGLSALAYDPTVGITSMTQTLAAQNSKITINGNLVTSNSNSIKDALNGVTIDLKKTSDPDKTTTLTLEHDKTALTNLVKDFIKQYNDSVTMINSVTNFDPSTKNYDPSIQKLAPLQGDAAIRGLKLKLHQLATNPIDKSDAQLRSLIDLGIKSDLKGLLIMDDKKFNNALDNHYDDIGAIFAKTASSSDGGVTVNGLDKTVKAGTYGVNLTDYIPNSSIKGTIGGILATSSDGMIFKGSGDLKGLSVNILSGGTGFRGNIKVTDGIASQLDIMLDQYLNNKDGVLTKKGEQYDLSMRTLEIENNKLIERAGNLEKSYLRKYTALDKLITQMQASAAAISQQFSNLNNN